MRIQRRRGAQTTPLSAFFGVGLDVAGGVIGIVINGGVVGPIGTWDTRKGVVLFARADGKILRPGSVPLHFVVTLTADLFVGHVYGNYFLGYII